MEEGVQQAVNMVQSMGIVEMEVFKVCGKSFGPGSREPVLGIRYRNFEYSASMGCDGGSRWYVLVQVVYCSRGGYKEFGTVNGTLAMFGSSKNK